jgi:putative transposase
MWQDDYYANSVSDSNVDKVMKYIKKQESHHAQKSFEEEEEALRRICTKQFTREVIFENA